VFCSGPCYRSSDRRARGLVPVRLCLRMCRYCFRHEPSRQVGTASIVSHARYVRIEARRSRSRAPGALIARAQASRIHRRILHRGRANDPFFGRVAMMRTSTRNALKFVNCWCRARARLRRCMSFTITKSISATSGLRNRRAKSCPLSVAPFAGPPGGCAIRHACLEDLANALASARQPFNL